MLKFRQNTLGPRFVVVRVTYNESITGRNPNCTAQRKTAGVGAGGLDLVGCGYARRMMLAMRDISNSAKNT